MVHTANKIPTVGYSRVDRIFEVFLRIFLVFVGLVTAYPLYYVIISSLSDASPVEMGAVLWFPMDSDRKLGITWASYGIVLSKNQFWISLANSFFYTIVGTVYAMIVTTGAAYALSRKQFPLRRLLGLALVTSMWLHPGFIPEYLNFKDLGIINNRWGMITSWAASPFYVILMRNYFESIPKELDESARIDGANDFRIFTSIYLPLSTPALLTIAIYYAVGKWNGFFWSLVLLRDFDLINLQVYVKQMAIDAQIQTEAVASMVEVGQSHSAETIKIALIVCSLIPVVVSFPLVQRFFSKGIMLGSVKE